MILFFQDERDKDFYAACEKIRGQKCYLSTTEIAKRAVHAEAQSFYLSNRGCAKIINRIKRGNIHTRSSAKRMLYEEIRRRYLLIISEHPHLTSAEIARRINAEKAPRFYITESRAVDLYYLLIKSNPRK